MKSIAKILFFAVLFLGCKKEEIKTKGIEFYLLEDDSNFNNYEKICKDFDFKIPSLQAIPIVSDEDVISYDWKIHEITISQGAYTKLKKYRDEKNRAIYPLVLTVNGKRIYGLFYKFAILASGCETTLITESGWGNVPKNGGENLSIIHGQVSLAFRNSLLSKDPTGNKRIYDYLKSTERLVE